MPESAAQLLYAADCTGKCNEAAALRLRQHRFPVVHQSEGGQQQEVGGCLLTPADVGHDCPQLQSCGCTAAVPAYASQGGRGLPLPHECPKLAGWDRCEGWVKYHPRIKSSILGLTKRARELAAHHHDVSAMTKHVALWYAHGGLPPMRVADEHRTGVAASLGRNSRKIVIQDARVLFLHKNTGGICGTRGVSCGLPEGPEPIRHEGRQRVGRGDVQACAHVIPSLKPPRVNSHFRASVMCAAARAADAAAPCLSGQQKGGAAWSLPLPQLRRPLAHF